MDVQTVDVRDELVQLVQAAFVVTPIVLRAPVLDESFHKVELDTVTPTGLVQLIWKSRPHQS